MKRWLAMALCAVLLVGGLPVVAGADSGLQIPVGPGDGNGPPALGSDLTMMYTETHTLDLFYGGDNLRSEDDIQRLRCDGVITEIKLVTIEEYTTWNVTVRAPGDGTITYTDTNNISSSVTIHYSDPYAGMTKIPAGDVSDEDKLNIEGLTFEPVAFTVSESGTNRTYYIGPAWASENLSNSPVRDDSQDFEENEKARWMFKAGFWTARAGTDGKLEYTPVGEETYTSLKSMFTDLSLTMRPTANCSRYPDRYSDAAAPSLTAEMSPVNAGTWVIHVQGALTSGGERINAYGKVACIPLTTNEYAPPALNSLNDVQEYFDRIKSVAQNNESYTFVIPASATPYDGTIVIPETPNGVDVKFIVKGGTDGAGHSVTIQGGVVADANKVSLVDLNFVGQGKGETENNDCLTGHGLASFENCTFTGFNKAIVCEGDSDLRWGGSGCTFVNNHIALYMNSTQDNGGNGDMNNMIFRSNDIALDLEHFAPGMQIYDHHITRCQFIDNQCDVRNATSRAFFLPKNYFESSSTVGTIKVCPESTGKVSAFPTATTTSFDTFDYSPKEALVSNQIEYSIPTVDLTAGKTITVIDQTADADKTLATWSFENEAGGTEP